MTRVEPTSGLWSRACGVAAAGLCAALAWVATGAAAANVVRTENVESRLLSEVTTVRPGETVWLALEQSIRPGWHTYWRNPGDSGLPTQIAWTLPPGLEAGEIRWPVPERQPVGPLMNYGYSTQVALLVPLTATAALDTTAPAVLSADATWLVCEEVCIPEEGSFTVALATAPEQPGAPPALDERWRGLFADARAALPVDSPWPVTYRADDDALTLRLAAPGLEASRLRDAYFFADQPDLVAHATPQNWRVDADGVTLTVPRGGLALEPGATLGGLVSLTEDLDGGPAVQTFTIAAVEDPLLADAGGGLTLWTAIAFALVGGIILNLMPCVLPVLSVKALGLAARGGDPAEARAHALAFLAGVLASFALIAAALLAVRAGGALVGWGFQLQSPLVVTLLAYVMTALGLSLSGLFDIGSRLIGVGSGLANRGGYGGAFMTGVLTAVVASPCTAPFMGAAVGFALTQPPAVSVAVLLALGLGLALPFVALSFSPALIHRLPRPGPWMETLKRVLALPMYATALWLLWVLHRQTGAEGVLAALLGLALIAGAALAVWRARSAGERIARWARLGATGAAIAALALALVPSTVPSVAPQASPGRDGALAYEPYSPARLAELRAEGRPVFVNATAAWCVTCIVNEAVALRSEEVADAFAAGDVAYLKADWTNHDPQVTRLLETYGRSGVPLYLFYPAGSAANGDPLAGAVALPQILTVGLLLDRLQAADVAVGLSGTRPTAAAAD